MKSALAERAAELTGGLVPVVPGTSMIRGINEKEGQAQLARVFEPQTNELKKGTRLLPMGDRLLVKKMTPAELTKNGLFIPEEAKEDTCVGVVLGAGQGRWTESGAFIPMPYIPGMVVVFGKYAGTGTPVGAVTDGEQLMLCQDEIMGVLADEEMAARIEAMSKPPITGARVAE